MIELKGTKKEQAVREWINTNMDGVIPMDVKIIDVFNRFKLDNPGISYGCVNSTIKKVIEEGHIVNPMKGNTNPNEEDNFEPEIINISDLKHPDFKLFKTGKKIDELFSDHEEGGGLYSSTVNIVIGESGVGKSTVLLDMLASIKSNNEDAKILYISSEMTRIDIVFYYRKTPAIANVPTLLLSDYIKSNKIDSVLKKVLNDDYDIIVLDSYQDIIVKLKEVQGWKSTFAESWLTNTMIDAAEKNGAAILAIQHMTKGGQYVGSTYLKHATTSMVELKFDDAGNRYIEFSKNRRGGSKVGKRLYFNLDKETGDVIYDAQRFDEVEELSELENKERIRQAELSREFEKLFNIPGENDDKVDEDPDMVKEFETSLQIAKIETSEDDSTE